MHSLYFNVYVKNFLDCIQINYFFILLSLGLCYRDNEANFLDRHFDNGADSVIQKFRSGEAGYVFNSISWK